MMGLIATAIGIFLTLALGYVALDPYDRALTQRRLKSVKARVGFEKPSIEAQLRKLALIRTKPRETAFTRLVPNREALEHRLRQAGQSWTAEHVTGAVIGLAILFFIILTLLKLSIVTALMIGAALGFAIPHLTLNFLISRRSQKFIEGFPVAIDLMARGIKSGLPISQTMEVIAAELEGPVREEFQSVTDAVRIGRTLDEGLKQVATRINMPEFQFFCIAIAVQRETGGNIGETLSNLSDVLRKRGQMKMKVKAVSSEARTSSSFMGILPILIVGAIHVLNPSYLEPFITNEKLTHVGIGAFIWMVMGITILVKMANFKI